jgi:hypothetical protein
MAKIRNPLNSISASGSIGERLTFSQRKSGQQARFQKKQSDKITTKRITERALYSSAVLGWNGLDTMLKENWKSAAYSRHMTGYNFYVKVFITEGIGYLYGERVFSLYTYGQEV